MNPAETSPEAFPELAAIVRPHPVSDFLERYWEREPLHIARAPGETAAPLVTLADIDAALTTRPQRHPDLQLVSAAREIMVDDYADEAGLVDNTKAMKLFAGGATIIINRLDESVPSIQALCARLEAELGIPIQANLYLTPGGAQGFPIHFDSHDVLVVQCVGRKTWRLYDRPKPLPMRGERFERATTPAGPLSATFTSSVGDVLYIPRGLMHDAVAADGEVSLHVTIGLHALRWSEVLVEALAEAALDDIDLRHGVPLGALVGRASPEAMAAAVRSRVERAMKSMRWEAVADKLAGRFLGEHKQTYDGTLLDAATEITDETVLLRRQGAISSVRLEGDAVLLRINGRTTRWPAHSEPALRAALGHERLRSDDLGDSLDAPGRLTLLKRLVSDGALRIAR